MLAARLGDAKVRGKLRRAICKFPTEWDKSTIIQRYQWLKADEEFKVEEGKAWDEFKAHAESISFDGLPQEYKDATWHVHPRTFISHMRQCGWLSPKEFAQCIPRSSLSGVVSWETALARAITHSIPYNKFVRVFCSGNMNRYLHNIAQSLIETGLFRTLTEDGRGAGKVYGAFYGRGYHQLTWAGNFKGFGEFKGFSNISGLYADSRITAVSMHSVDSGGQLIRWSPRYDPSVVEADATQAGSASGFYWVSKRYRGTLNINRVCDAGVSGSTVGFISWLVNGGAFGYSNRQQFSVYLSNILLDESPRSGVGNFNYPGLSSALTSHFPLGNNIPQNKSEMVNYARQIP